MVLVTVLFARRRFGERVALLAGLIVATSLLVVALARLNIIDTAALARALDGGVRLRLVPGARASGRSRPRPGRALRPPLLLRGGRDAQGARRPRPSRAGRSSSGRSCRGGSRSCRGSSRPGPSILFLVLVLPWHVAIARRDGEWFDFYVVGEHFRRYFESGHRRDGSPPLLRRGRSSAASSPGPRSSGGSRGPFPRSAAGSGGRGGPRRTSRSSGSSSSLFFSALAVQAHPLHPAGLAGRRRPRRARPREGPAARGPAPRRRDGSRASLFGLLAGVVAAYAFGAGMAARYGVQARSDRARRPSSPSGRSREPPPGPGRLPLPAPARLDGTARPHGGGAVDRVRRGARLRPPVRRPLRSLPGRSWPS